MKHLVAIIVFLVLIAAVIVMGFMAGRWKGGDLAHIEEWGLGGRRFGTLISWFLIGGDAYTAYTFIAIPALMFGAGAIGFFAVPYTVVCYPILYLVFPKLWKVAHKYGYITGPEFVRGRYGNRWLALAVGVTGIAATMPYIALQLIGMQVIIGALGIPGHLPLIAAFAVLAAFTWTSGLRAPAMISIVKDLLIYLTVLVAIIVIPVELGGFGHIFAKIPSSKLLLAVPPSGSFGAYSGYATLALGSAMALFLYPHTTTGILSSAGPKVLRRNAALLPAYTVLLSLLALLGFMAVATGVDKLPQFAAGFAQYKSSFAVPALFLHEFPDWFVGIGFAAIAIGALVPAAIMAIASANIFTRDIYEPFVSGSKGSAETLVAKLFAMVMVMGALVFIVAIPTKFAVQLQLLGGMWVIQTFPAIAFSVFTRFFNGWALLIGWLVGVVSATWLVVHNIFGAVWAFHVFGYTVPSYIALATVVLNAVVAFLLSIPLNAMANDRHKDETEAADYA
ncbi:monocarboxylate uptake permease MctP [Acidocella aminolytica]|jgi:SSS family solute:Na+ symporter|uniref:Na+/solute symporter n=1 Tax=Acidocella aminolytica 101 = DSM 11237 TaxID=1120923 RepID=A0A0D6PDQ2_9PROT|nr:sodium:solute symporter [Acidocella aminolytica]GAN79328.1 Na+/solute symporter [Acidocella aminolytica 101 = DSM 11237]GBQ39515.1 Na+/proline symporter [Acidocella aminolytica 101 = DSM 11237]SHE38451.1 solute:Na+ symporter, SSS family [Acidocella aminolytica 101 = DSM 11237]